MKRLKTKEKVIKEKEKKGEKGKKENQRSRPGCNSGNKLKEKHDEEVKVCEAMKLQEEVFEDKVEDGVMAGFDSVGEMLFWTLFLRVEELLV